MNPTLMIMAGGTGGHVMPGLAVAQEMRSRSWHVVWLGNPAGMEADLVKRHDITMLSINVGGVRGKGLLTKLLTPLMLLRAFWQSLVALRRSKPAVVLGMGGYVAFPGGMMASLLNRPLVIHEQNSVAGLSNRVLAKLADKTLVAFPDSLPGANWCGNPLRRDMLADDDPAARILARQGQRLNVLVVGGSLGAKALNDVVPEALALIPEQDRPTVVHQGGRGKCDAVRDNYKAAGVTAEVFEFIDDVGQAYRDADLVVCRAGAMTVAELAAIGVASILVPYPFAVDDHQTGNAQYLSQGGGALLMQQTELTPATLASSLRELNRERLAKMAAMARRSARLDATRDVADVCEALAGTTKVSV